MSDKVITMDEFNSDASIDDLEEKTDKIQRIQKIVAKIRKSKYDAQIAAGFTPEQALQILLNDDKLF
jgi:hypothetical protein